MRRNGTMPPSERGRHRKCSGRRLGRRSRPSEPEETAPPEPGPGTSEVQAAVVPGGMRSKAIRSFVWTGSQTLVVRLLSLLTFTILARLLTPRDYGVAAVAGVFAALAALLAAGGFSQAIAQKETVDRGDLDSIFWISMATGFTMTALTVCLSWPLAAFFGLPELKAVLWTLSPMFVAIAVSSPQMG